MVVSPILLFGQKTDSTENNNRSKKITNQQWIDDLNFIINKLDSVHPYPYFNISKEQFVVECKKVRELIPQSSDNEILIEFHKLIAMINDGHTRFLGNKLTGKWYPIRIEQFSDGFFITAADIKYEYYIGLKVIRVNDVPIDSAFNLLINITSGDNKYAKRYFAPVSLTMNSIVSGLHLTDKNNNLILLIEKKGKKQVLTISPVNFNSGNDLAWYWKDYGVPSANYTNIIKNYESLPLYLKNYNKPFWFEFLPEFKTVYFGFNECVGDNFINFNSKLWNFIDSTKAENLIVDLRNNFGGTNSYLKPFIQEIIKHENINKKGHLFVITGNKTFSAAMHFATWIEQQCNPVFVGQPTGAKPNHFADPDFSFLPNSELLLLISKYYWQNALPWDDRDFIEPEYKIDISSSDYFNFKDPVVDKVLMLINSKL